MFASSIVPCLEHRGRFTRPPRSGRDRESAVGRASRRAAVFLGECFILRGSARRLGTGTVFDSSSVLQKASLHACHPCMFLPGVPKHADTTVNWHRHTKMTTAAHASLVRAMDKPSEAVSPMCLFLQSMNEGGTSSSSAPPQAPPSASEPMDNVSDQSSTTNFEPSSSGPTPDQRSASIPPSAPMELQPEFVPPAHPGKPPAPAPPSSISIRATAMC